MNNDHKKRRKNRIQFLFLLIGAAFFVGELVFLPKSGQLSIGFSLLAQTIMLYGSYFSQQFQGKTLIFSVAFFLALEILVFSLQNTFVFLAWDYVYMIVLIHSSILRYFQGKLASLEKMQMLQHYFQKEYDVETFLKSDWNE